MMIPKMSEKIFWRYFALFSPQDVSRDLWRGRRQAVDHLGADLIQDLVLETVLLRTSNCISSGFCLYFFAFLWVCTAVCTLLLVSDCFIARLLVGGFTRLLGTWRRWWRWWSKDNSSYFEYKKSCTLERESKCVDFKSVSAIHWVTCKRRSGGAGEIYRSLMCSNLATYKQSYTVIDKEWINTKI